jgi:hypothetical protein
MTEMLAATIVVAVLLAALIGYVTGHWHGRRTARWEGQLDAGDTWTAPLPQLEAAVPLPQDVPVSDDTQAWLDGLPSRVDALIESWAGDHVS